MHPPPPPALRARVFRRAAQHVARAAVAAAALSLALAACGREEEVIFVEEQPVDQLYNEAMDELMSEDYKSAADTFDAVERQHPYSVWATRGQLMSAFSHYRRNNYAEALVTLDRFISLHPGHEYVDYAHYLRGMCYYEQISDVARDQKISEQAREAFEELTRRFPESKYAADAEGKLVLIRDQLAGKEMEIGRYYQKRGHYLAAINRFRAVVDDYETTSHTPEALHRLTELYLALGVPEEAQKTAAVLGYNFPGSKWYADSYRLLTRGPRPVASAEGAGGGDPSFFSRAWDWVF